MKHFQLAKCFFTVIILFASGSSSRFLSLVAERSNSQRYNGHRFPHLVQLIVIIMIPNVKTET